MVVQVLILITRSYLISKAVPSGAKADFLAALAARLKAVPYPEGV
jgi:hypothetical protein